MIASTMVYNPRGQHPLGDSDAEERLAPPVRSLLRSRGAMYIYNVLYIYIYIYIYTHMI